MILGLVGVRMNVRCFWKRKEVKFLLDAVWEKNYNNERGTVREKRFQVIIEK